MSPPSRFSRRAFIGLAAGAAAIPAVTAGLPVRRAGRHVPYRCQAHPAARACPRRGPVPENSLPGDPRWDIRHLGGPDAMMGYAGQASVLPGEPITLYASTTGRSFTVTAFRMGWYGGDLARKVWRSGTVTGHKQNKPVVLKPANTVEARWDSVRHDPHPRLARGQLPAADGLGGRPAAVRPRHRAVGEDRGQDRDQELGGDLAGLQHVGRLRPVQRARRDHRLQPPLAGGQPGPALSTGRAPTCSSTTSGS